MVASGLVLGLVFGGYLPYAREIGTVALIVAMTLALSEIQLKGLSLASEVRAFSQALGWNYVGLTGLILAFALLTPDPDLRAGWVVMAAVPSAIAVVPLTSIAKGDVRGALVSTALLYALSLALVPAITLVFVGRAPPLLDLAVQTFLQIGLPLLASRVLVRLPGIERVRPVGVNLSFFVLVTMVAGANRSAFADLGLVVSLSGAALLRTFGIGLAVAGLATLSGRSAADKVSWILFSSFKNLGLTALLAFSLFDRRAAIPAIVCLLFEILWLASFPFVVRGRKGLVRGGPGAGGVVGGIHR